MSCKSSKNASLYRALRCGDVQIYNPNLCLESHENAQQLVTLVNKLGAYFKFEVPHSLTVEDVSLDGADSSS